MSVVGTRLELDSRSYGSYSDELETPLLQFRV